MKPLCELKGEKTGARLPPLVPLLLLLFVLAGAVSPPLTLFDVEPSCDN